MTSITYEVTDKDKSGLYFDLLKVRSNVNNPDATTRLRLLDLPRLRRQMLQLRRYVTQGKPEKADAWKDLPDDVANAVAGVVSLLMRGDARPPVADRRTRWRGGRTIGRWRGDWTASRTTSRTTPANLRLAVAASDPVPGVARTHLGPAIL